MKPSTAVSIIAHDLTIIVQADGLGQRGTRDIKECICPFLVTKKAMSSTASKTKARNFAPLVHRFRRGTLSSIGTRNVCQLRLCVEHESAWACDEIPHDCSCIVDVIQRGETKLPARSRNINAAEEIGSCVRSEGVSPNNDRLQCQGEAR